MNSYLKYGIIILDKDKMTDSDKCTPFDGRSISMQGEPELAQLRKFVSEAESTNHSGVIVEIGVHLGCSAKAIASSKKAERKLFLFDSWRGMPKEAAQDINPSGLYDVRAYNLRQGDLCVPMEEAVNNLKEFPNVIFSPGIFPKETGSVLDNTKIVFAHLDVDFYNGTMDSLNFLFDKMVLGGKIVCHDYSTAPCPGVFLACNEFANKMGGRIELSRGVSSTAIIVKKGN